MSATEATTVNPIQTSTAWDSDQGRRMESDHEDPKKKILEFSQLSEQRTILDPSQVTVLNELEFYASTLTELDISRIMASCVELYLQHNLQYLHNLKKLTMDHIGLKTVPGSVGALKRLEVLSVASNSLKNLPVTLRYCQNLCSLNVMNNEFKFCIEGIVLQLENLKVLDHDRKARPACERGYTHAMTTRDCAQRPYTLQTICAGAVVSAQMDYWDPTVIGGRQRKVLDEQANRLDLCHNCKRAIPLPSRYTVETYLVKFLDRKGIALINVCSEPCQEIVCSEYTRKNAQIFEELVRERAVRAVSPRANYLEEVTKLDKGSFSISPAGSRGTSPSRDDGTENTLPLPPRGIPPPPRENTGHPSPPHTRGLPRPTAPVRETVDRLPIPPQGIRPIPRRQHELTQAERVASGIGTRQRNHVPVPAISRDYDYVEDLKNKQIIYGLFTDRGILVGDEVIG